MIRPVLSSRISWIISPHGLTIIAWPYVLSPFAWTPYWAGANINENVAVTITDKKNNKTNALAICILLENIDVFDKLLDCNVEINCITTNEKIYPFSLELAIHKKNKYMINALLQHKNIYKCFTKSINCVVCHSDINLSWCSECKIIGYCSKKCQKEDWPIHKLYCRHITKKK